MKKRLVVILALVLVFTSVFFTACGDKKPEGDTSTGDISTLKINVGTGGSTGTYYGYCNVISTVLKEKTGAQLMIQSSGASKANILDIDDGIVDMAIVQNDVMDYAYNGTSLFEKDGKIQTFSTLGAVYAEVCQVVARADSGIKTIADLKGKKVSIGAAGSGVYFNAMDILAAAGLTEKDINPQYLNFDQSADGLKDGKIDAAFIVAGAPTPAITELCMTNAKTRIVPIDGAIADKLMKDNTFYSVYKIPAGTYANQASATEDDVYKITKAIFDNIADITKEHAKGAELSLENATEGLTVPFHAGAAKYFKEKNIEVAVK